MATNRPVGDNTRVGAVRGNHKVTIRLQDCGPSVIRRREDSWMLRRLAIHRLKV